MCSAGVLVGRDFRLRRASAPDNRRISYRRPPARPRYFSIGIKPEIAPFGRFYIMSKCSAPLGKPS